MAEYIDREAVCKRLVEAADVQRKAKSKEFAAGIMGAQGVVWLFPATENVVDVVRCRECRLHGICSTEDVFRFADLSEENRYCGAGKRREDGDA